MEETELAKLKESLKARGLSFEVYSDGPGEEYSPHSHDFYSELHVIEGEMTVQVADEETTLTLGEFFKVHANVEHSAVIGDEGCVYIDAIKQV